MPRDSRPCVKCGGGDNEGLMLLCATDLATLDHQGEARPPRARCDDPFFELVRARTYRVSS